MRGSGYLDFVPAILFREMRVGITKQRKVGQTKCVVLGLLEWVPQSS